MLIFSTFKIFTLQTLFLTTLSLNLGFESVISNKIYEIELESSCFINEQVNVQNSSLFFKCPFSSCMFQMNSSFVLERSYLSFQKIIFHVEGESEDFSFVLKNDSTILIEVITNPIFKKKNDFKEFLCFSLKSWIFESDQLKFTYKQYQFYKYRVSNKPAHFFES